MKSVGIFHAKTRLSSLIDDVAGGESFIITKNGRPIARVVPYAERTARRDFGFDEGRIDISDDFDAMKYFIRVPFSSDARRGA